MEHFSPTGATSLGAVRNGGPDDPSDWKMDEMSLQEHPPFPMKEHGAPFPEDLTLTRVTGRLRGTWRSCVDFVLGCEGALKTERGGRQ